MDFESFKKNFSDRLRHLRNQRKISAREMSLELGQNVNYINYIENGRHLPSMQGFFFICDYLKIQPADFFEKDSESSASETDSVAIFSSLSEKQQKSIVSMIKTFLSMSS